MIGILAAALGVGFVSAFFPGLPAEPYLIGAVATTSAHPVPLALATAVGQSAGKLVILLAVRGTLHAPALRQWIEKKRAALAERAARDAARDDPGPLRRLGARLVKLAQLNRTTVAAPLLLVSAIVGIPPLIVMTFTAAAGQMSAPAFLATCLTGRSVRMLIIAFAPSLLVGHL
ncbi:VTT domain-containing protein [Micromonospora robiginosa]|uniref:VTT domain-containing protein n=1 Tax=Micromonospora robiginosa TaxID=2749844 RepID=A0A7L6B3M0_9ACTN|nr:VTT domain-containing protein [Micromonospora ferruginea]QLQ36526.1 VTT domain-containing protein [Micromonospora ferruginea]